MPDAKPSMTLDDQLTSACNATLVQFVMASIVFAFIMLLVKNLSGLPAREHLVRFLTQAEYGALALMAVVFVVGQVRMHRIQGRLIAGMGA